MAAMTLLLAHLDSSGDPGSHNDLAHQYTTDRAAIEQVQEHIEEVNRLDSDAHSAQSVNVLRRLLAIRVDNADGRLDFVRRVTVHEPRNETVPPSDSDDHDTIFSTHVPYFGIFKIAPEGMTPATAMTNRQSENRSRSEKDQSLPALFGADDRSPIAKIPFPSGAMGGKITTSLSSVDQIATIGSPVWQFYNNEVSRQPEEYLNVAAVGEDWPFQGIDMTYLENTTGDSFANDADNLHQEDCNIFTQFWET